MQLMQVSEMKSEDCSLKISSRMAKSDEKDVPGRRPVTRSLVKSGLILFTPTATKPNPKKVKFVEPDSSSSLAIHNSSVATDEGIDLSFSSPRAGLNIPAIIARPHHELGQAWTFWFSGNNRRDSWTQDLVSVANMTTVEEFWTIYNQVCLRPVCRSLLYRTISRSSPAAS